MNAFKATDPCVDAYIEKAADFAKPILRKLRRLVHEACPDCQETIKWGFASFDYKGTFCSMASFKEHCVFGFWKTQLLQDPEGVLQDKKGQAMGSLGRITCEADLPPDEVITGFILQAKKLNDEGIKLPTKSRNLDIQPAELPDDFSLALTQNSVARNQWATFSPSKKKEYIDWIKDAKAADTRQRRLATSIEWISEGKGRNWKYERPK